jgi:hypothetical protein
MVATKLQNNKKTIILNIKKVILIFIMISIADILYAANNERYLFVQSAHDAKIRKSSSDGLYTITLSPVSKFVTSFTERPARKAKLIPIEDLLRLWQGNHPEGFNMNPPNADINGVLKENSNEDPINYLVELRDPVYDSAAKTLTYTIKPMDGNPSALPDSATLHHVTLFIDDVCLSCFWP